MKYSNMFYFLFIQLLIVSHLLNALPQEEQKEFFEFDPSFNQELVPMQPEEPFLNAGSYLSFKLLF